MKKTMVILLVIALLCGNIGCAQEASTEAMVAQSEYDALKKELVQIKDELEEVKSKLTESEENCTSIGKELLDKENDLKAIQNDLKVIQDEYNQFKEEAMPFLKLTQEKQEAELAQAEADKINAEENARKAKEAADIELAKKVKAEADKKAKEEAARLAEEKKGYNTGITFLNLSRNPDNYIGKKVKFSGKVAQVIEGFFTNAARMSTKGRYNDVIYIEYESDLIQQRLIEDDTITIYGVADGLYTYTTIMGGEVTLPKIIVEKMEIK